MAVKLNKTSHYPIMLRTRNNETGATRRTRFHSPDAASIAAGQRIDNGSTIEQLGYVTDPK